jgi:hypothetical protein
MLVLSSDIVDAIEIDNTRRNTVRASLRLRYESNPIHLWLSGDAEPGFVGRRVHLETVESHRTRPGIPDELDVEQLGPTGRMGIAAGGRAIVEWHSQFGPTRIELDGATVELLDGPPLVVWPSSLFSDDAMLWDDVPPRGDSERLWHWAEDYGDLFDDVPLASVFDPPLQLPRSDDQDDAQVGRMLKTLLARLASEWVSVDLCTHAKPRDVYEYLRRILRDERLTMTRQRMHRSVQHLPTFESCRACQEEIECFFPDVSALIDD